MLVKVDMAVLEHDLIQSQVVMLLENKLIVYLFIEGIEGVILMPSQKQKLRGIDGPQWDFSSTMPIAERGCVITCKEPGQDGFQQR